MVIHVKNVGLTFEKTISLDVMRKAMIGLLTEVIYCDKGMTDEEARESAENEVYSYLGLKELEYEQGRTLLCKYLIEAGLPFEYIINGFTYYFMIKEVYSDGSIMKVTKEDIDSYGIDDIIKKIQVQRYYLNFEE